MATRINKNIKFTEVKKKKSELEPNEYKVDKNGCIKFLGGLFYLQSTLANKVVSLHIDDSSVYAIHQDASIRYTLVKR